MHALLQDAAISVGAPAPDVTFTHQDGHTVALKDLRGRSVLLVFFPEAWDPARRQQVDLYHDAAGVDDERFALLTDTGDSAAAASFGVAGSQAAYVVDESGIVRWRHVAPPGVHPHAADVRDALSQGAPRLTRRQFLMTAVAASLLAAAAPKIARAQTDAARAKAPPEPGARTIVLNVNGADHRVTIEPRVTLLDALRERLGLFGTKKGCDHGQCGACTVHLDGRRVNACLTLAMQAEGARVTTIEGLARDGRLHPVQAAFIRSDGFQCGYCTPGQIMSAVACIAEGHAGSEDEIREWMSGNICRCGAYRGICRAVAEANGGGRA